MRNATDGSTNAPRYVPFINMGNFEALPEWSTAPTGDFPEVLAGIKEAGFEGVQGGDAEQVRDAGLLYSTSGRIDDAEQAEDAAKMGVDTGAICVTVHAGTGWEDDAAADKLVDLTLEASAKHDMPIYIETHRATITQDHWRCTQLANRNPEMRFNGDFSHWYTGLEMWYGDIDAKFDFATPVFDRVRFLHGRIGNPGSMQVSVGETYDEALEKSFVQHFLDMWTRCCKGFQKDAQPGDVLGFAPELLHPEIFYAREMTIAETGELREESDRWQQALIYKDLFQKAWDDAAG